MRDALRVAVAAVVVAAIVALPQIAAACPSCAANDDAAGGIYRWIAVGAFILLPFAVVAVSAITIVKMVRRAKELESHTPTSAADS